MADAVQGLPPAVAEGAQSSIAFTQSEQVAQLGPAAQHLVAAAQHAFVDGISGALLIAAGIVAVTAVVVARLSPATGAQPGLRRAAGRRATRTDERVAVPVP